MSLYPSGVLNMHKTIHTNISENGCILFIQKSSHRVLSCPISVVGISVMHILQLAHFLNNIDVPPYILC
jgi:hypothetical protein